ncbi:MAG: DUF2784 domain-containing protein [Thermodesulfobacteriota bacterium]|nr:DUF2784 domain-containing protein [Thermodesulfobacteriota bacterium]
MLYKNLADLVLTLHFAFVLFAMLGALLVLIWQRLAWIHIPLALWAVIVEITGWMCPLTPLEHWLRLKGGIPVEQLGFVEQYLYPLLYPTPLTRGFQVILGAVVLGVNLLIYGWILRRRRSRKG